MQHVLALGTSLFWADLYVLLKYRGRSTGRDMAMSCVSRHNPGTPLPPCLHLKLNSFSKLFCRKMHHSMEVIGRQRSSILKRCQAQGKGQGTNQLDDAISIDGCTSIDTTPVVSDQDEEYNNSVVALNEAESGRVAVLSAAKFSSMEIKEREKSLGKSVNLMYRGDHLRQSHVL